MSKIPDFEGLAIFAKVAEERSFAGAARALSVSVATVSRAVSRLEERLGGRLLNRTSRQIALTEFGITVAERASRVFDLAEEAEGLARELSARPRGQIKLSAPMSFGVRWLAPLLPEFFKLYPEVAIDLHLSDETIDLVGQGFDAALRIAVLPDSSLVARRLCPVARYILAAPEYLAKFGTPKSPTELDPNTVLGYAYRARNDVWRLTNDAGEEVSLVPQGQLRVTNVDALIPTVLAGLAVCELPEFIASQYILDKLLVPILTDWKLPSGGLYFVIPSARTRPAKIEALANFFYEHLSNPEWSLKKDNY